MRLPYVRTTALALVVFAGLIAVEVMLLTITVGRGPNSVSAPMVEQFALLATLWSSNPTAALPLTAQQPVFMIAHSTAPGNVPVWGIYFFPLSFFVHLVLAATLARYWRRSAGHRREPGLLAAGSAALMFAVAYTRLASCCTGGPRWALEIMLLALAFDPTQTLLDWSAIIVNLERFFPYLQFALGMTGIALLITAMWRLPKSREAE